MTSAGKFKALVRWVYMCLREYVATCIAEVLNYPSPQTTFLGVNLGFKKNLLEMEQYGLCVFASLQFADWLSLVV